MNIKHPDTDDIKQIMQLNSKYFLSNTTDDQIQNGYLGKKYSIEELQQIVADKEIIICTTNNKVIGYYLLGRKDDEDASVYQINKELSLVDPFSNIAYPTQVCIDEAYRNHGLFGKMLYVLVNSVKDKYTSLFCSISENNIVSIKAHIKNGWQLINTFETRKFFIYKT